MSQIAVEPILKRSDLFLSTDYQEAKDEAEKTIVNIWQQVMNIDSIGVNDDFFEVGGDSLGATELAGELETIFRCKFSPSHIIEASTVSQQVVYIKEQKNKKQEMKQDDLLNEIPPNMTILNRRGKKNPLFLIHGGIGYTLYSKLLLEGLDKDQPIVFIEAVGLDGKKPPLDRVETIALHYFSSMVKIAPKGDWLIAANCAGGLIATEICHLADQSGDRVSRLLLIDPTPTHFLTLQQRRLQKRKKRFVKRFFYRIPFLGTIAQKISQGLFLCSEDEEKKAFEASLDDRQKRQEKREVRFQDRISGENSSMVPSEIAYNAKAMRCVAHMLTKAFDKYTPSPWNGQTFVLQTKERAHMSEILKNSFPNAKIRIVSIRHNILFSEGLSEIQKLFSDALSIDPEEKFL